MVYPRYSVLFPSLKEVRDSLQQAYFAQQPKIEAKAKDMQPADMQRYLNDYSVEQAQRMLERWKQLAFYLVVKYNDMAVKPDKDGRFLRTKYGLGERVTRPGFASSYARKVLENSNNKFIVPNEKK